MRLHGDGDGDTPAVHSAAYHRSVWLGNALGGGEWRTAGAEKYTVPGAARYTRRLPAGQDPVDVVFTLDRVIPPSERGLPGTWHHCGASRR